ncbi:MAG: Pr6Pr family membrane protein [Clostridia bacterium]|nr:Pr6Pr family membrane protein [Clostridia bacterium]
MIRTKCFSVASKVLIAFFALTGITIQTGIIEGDFDFRIFRMFTNISNLMCAIYFIFAATIISLDKSRNGGSSPFPLFKGICTMSITLTGIVAAAVVGSEMTADTASGISTVLLHIVTPILIVTDWLLFDTKGRWHKTAPIWWLITPLLYFIYIMVTAQFMDSSDELRFPYPFLDYEQTGLPFLMIIVFVIAFFYIGIGYLCFFIDRKMGYLEKPLQTDI